MYVRANRGCINMPPQQGLPLQGQGPWSETAMKAIVENPEYFVWWYTVKSVALCGVAAYAAYLYGKSKGQR